MAKDSMSLAEIEDNEYESECKTCRFFYGLDLPTTDPMPHELLTSKATARSMQIFRSWVQLNTTLKRYEEVIRKRWFKKNHGQRTRILCEAWPGIPATHRPDFDGLR